ncbi:hypothetical protein FQZ97_709390 [compost metagenome]
MMPSSAVDDDVTAPSRSFCAADSGERCSSSRLPMIALSGVRISWLIMARKADFAWLAWCAASRALSKARSAFLRVVMSEKLHSSTSLPWYLVRTTLTSSSVTSPLASVTGSSRSGSHSGAPGASSYRRSRRCGNGGSSGRALSVQACITWFCSSTSPEG